MGPTGDTKLPPRPMRGSDRAGRRGGSGAARRGRARRNAARIGVSGRGWVDLDGTDRGHQASPSTEAPLELGRCGRRCPRTHAHEQVFANVTRSGKCTWISVFHLIPFILTRFFVGCMFPLLMPGLDSSGATEQCWHICSCEGKR